MKNTIAVLAALTVLALPANPRAADAQPGRHLARATFAGGCFWCMEPPFDKVDGVISTTSGYTGGTKKNPTYEEVSSGGTGHAESVQVVYDPPRSRTRSFWMSIWHNIDPTDANRQFCDTGEQYRTAIFYHDDEQKRARGGVQGGGREEARQAGRDPDRGGVGRFGRPRSTTRTTT